MLSTIKRSWKRLVKCDNRTENLYAHATVFRPRAIIDVNKLRLVPPLSNLTEEGKTLPFVITGCATGQVSPPQSLRTPIRRIIVKWAQFVSKTYKQQSQQQGMVFGVIQKQSSKNQLKKNRNLQWKGSALVTDITGHHVTLDRQNAAIVRHSRSNLVNFHSDYQSVVITSNNGAVTRLSSNKYKFIISDQSTQWTRPLKNVVCSIIQNSSILLVSYIVKHLIISRLLKSAVIYLLHNLRSTIYRNIDIFFDQNIVVFAALQ